MKRVFFTIVMLVLCSLVLSEWKPLVSETLPTPESLLAATVEADKELEPLKVILIWHQHQPLYKIPGTTEYNMPWVRAHAVNDYPFMADLVDQYLTRGKVTFNLVPSLLLQLNDYVENGVQDKYMILSIKESLTESERAFVVEHFFDINPKFIRISERYTQLLEMRNSGHDFTQDELIDLRVLWNLYWINIDYINSDSELTKLLEKDRDYTIADLRIIMEKQLQLMSETISKYSQLWKSGRVELTTTPMYHPILPILIDKGWKEDAIAQLEIGLDYFSEVMGRRPIGIWPSEQAVHDELVPIMANLDVEWIVTDKSILQKAGVNTGDKDNLFRPYKLIRGEKSLTVFFRDTELSDRIGFAYSNIEATQAVEDFVSRLHEIQRGNMDGNAVVTIALDGENAWENYPNNGNDFRKILYQTLSADDAIELVTPRQYLERYEVTDRLVNLPTGSWAGGSLDTWIGEKEEDEAWAMLEKARVELMNRLSTLDQETAKLAFDALFTAEGSDWFWWYGADQDAGNNETLFDQAFKRALVQLYKTIGIQETEIPPYLYVTYKRPATATTGSIGVIKPSIDGIMEKGEWDKAAYFGMNSISTRTPENNLLSGAHVGRDNSNLYISIVLKKKPSELIGEPLYLEVYTDSPGVENINPLPRYPFSEEASPGFSLSRRFFVSFRSWEKLPGRIAVHNVSNDGEWSVDPEFPSVDQGAAINDVIELKIPFDVIGVKTGQEFNTFITLSNSKEKLTIDYMPRSGPINVIIPQAVTGREVALFNDPEGDDNGPGNYLYPENSAFSPFKGLFDIEYLKVLENEQSLVFQFRFFEMTNPWGAPKGFSHQLINLYIDSIAGGRTDTYSEGARVAFDTDHPWDYFIKAAGWPSYGQLFANSDGEEIPGIVQIEADPGEKTINIIVSKEALDLKGGKLYLYVFSGSQDGYGQDHFRAVTREPSEWTLGGYPTVSGDFAPYVLDIIVPEGYTQKEILSSYDKDSERFSILKPIEIVF